MEPVLFHIDVNSAYLSWTAVEKLRQDERALDLRTVPSIIGGDISKRHGIVTAASIPAKRLGIRTAEPVVSAVRKCPDLIIEPVDFTLYRRESKKLMDLLRTYTPDIEQLSVDECFLDFTPIARHYESPVAAAYEIKDDVRDRFGFTVNVGIAHNRFLAKMASDLEKPDKVHTLFPEDIESKLWPLPVGDMFMVGRSAAARLQSFGIRTIGDLAHADINFLTSEFKSAGRSMYEHANGRGSAVIHPEEREAKGIGNSTTLPADAKSVADAFPVILTLSENVSRRLRKAGQKASTVTLEIKYSDFSSCSHQTGLFSPANDTDTLYDTGRRLFTELWDGRPIRLLGLRGTNLSDVGAPQQLSIFDLTEEDEPPKKSEKADALDHALDPLRAKYGSHIVSRGSDNLSVPDR